MSPSPRRSPRRPSPQIVQILLAVSDKQLHGYAIIREVERLSGGALSLTASTLYSALRRMLADGLIEETEERPVPELDDERRRYVTITPKGADLLRDEARMIEQIARMARLKGVLDSGTA